VANAIRGRCGVSAILYINLYSPIGGSKERNIQHINTVKKQQKKKTKEKKQRASVASDFAVYECQTYLLTF